MFTTAEVVDSPSDACVWIRHVEGEKYRDGMSEKVKSK